jgi:5-methylcytosine-specific restriction endonuclease McrA
VGDANTLDHLIPRAKGGTDADHNMHGACSRCNFSKSDENAMTWYRRQHFYSPEGEARIREWEV